MLSLLLILMEICAIFALAIRSPSPLLAWVFLGIFTPLIVYWMAVLFCLDLVFIRYVLGKRAWESWQNCWSAYRILIALLSALFLGASTAALLAHYYEVKLALSQSHRADPPNLFALPALIIPFIFVYLHSLYRDNPMNRRLGLWTYGWLLALILSLWLSVRYDELHLLFY